MKAQNIKLSPEQINILSELYKNENFAEFNERFADATGLVEVNDLVDAMNQISDEIKNYRTIVNDDIAAFSEYTETDAANLIGIDKADNKNLNYFTEYSAFRTPDFIRAAQQVEFDFLTLRRMSLMLDEGKRKVVRRAGKITRHDDGLEFFTTDKEVAEFIASAYNLTVNFKALADSAER